MKKLLTILTIAASTAAAEDAYVDFQTLTPELALTMAQQAMVSCEERGYQVGVTVVDRFGQPQAYLKNRYAGLHVYDTCLLYTSPSPRDATLSRMPSSA